MSRCTLSCGLIFLGFVSCSPVRYHYFFDRPGKAVTKTTLSDLPANTSLDESVVLSETSLEASTAVSITNSPGIISSIRQTHKPNGAANLTPKQKVQTPMPPKSEKGHMDNDLKRSIIFVTAGLFALFIGGTVFWVLGSLSVAIGIIFGIKWVVRQ